MHSPWQKNRNQQEAGFVLPLVLAVIGIIGIVAVYLISRSTNNAKLAIHSQADFAAANIVSELKQLVINTTAWGHTLNYGSNTTLACLYQNTSAGCPATYGSGISSTNYPATNAGAFVLMDQAGKIFYDSTVSTNGFDYDGRPCPYSNSNTYSNSNNTQTYGASTGGCPFRAVLYWVPTCTTACNGSQTVGGGTVTGYTVSGYVLFSPNSNTTNKVPFNTNNFTFSVVKASPSNANSGYCCAIECSHQTESGTPGYANATIQLNSQTNCYPGSPEVPATICSDTFGTSDQTNWIYSGIVNVSALTSGCSL